MPQIELKLRYKFRIILDETWSYGVLGRNGRGLTEHQNVDPVEVDMIIGSLAGPLCAGGGFCAGTEEITEHQRLMAAAYTYSAALPALLATVACEVIQMLTTSPEMISQVREHTRLMWQQLDPRSDWVRCSSAAENPMMLLVFKPEVVAARKWDVHDQEQVMQDIVDEVSVSSTNVATSPTSPQRLPS
jgi:serine palmitoyltransferase